MRKYNSRRLTGLYFHLLWLLFIKRSICFNSASCRLWTKMFMKMTLQSIRKSNTLRSMITIETRVSVIKDISVQSKVEQSTARSSRLMEMNVWDYKSHAFKYLHLLNSQQHVLVNYRSEQLQKQYIYICHISSRIFETSHTHLKYIN